MNVRVLGCHGSGQLVAGANGPIQCGTCGFLVNDQLLVDAGTIGSRLFLEEQRRIRVVLLTHLHFDHIRELPTLADNLVGEIEAPVVIAAMSEVLDGLRTHIFNGTVYPDFFRLPDPARPVFVPYELEAGREDLLCGLGVTPIRVNHVVPTVGFLLREGAHTVLYSGDTYRTDTLWQRAKGVTGLRAAFIESSFPNAMDELARVAKHLTPVLLAQEFAKMARPELPVYAYHLKPRFREQIRQELGQLGLPHLTALEEGQTLVL
ncbi:MAG: 3',5'-cyclic-nucleotide phosphodiesterase [Nitrospira sp.]|jgi:ribonuclease BN (tRNA processing enzyme)|nr:3',5'-cyclic-nucleotide phosphodiesterase [Nitrospira sp.]MBP6606176.1 3',5'-cyclic-nucleotide phosphodiesterase [Nitrospira sp.]HQY58996.1 3',5'-cyclic-nucleotide phosphodiesterase [Nitrospira sp.]HRA96169.1 3',5'-cyclic-nucleotide phosphodiesterase [Nitrospira sp.]